MGKKTLYHPVSLHVIRGAAEYCGFQFSRLYQRKADPEELTASYIAEIVGIPTDASQWPLWRIFAALTNCFMDDIRVVGIWHTDAKVLMCQLDVALNRKATLEEIADDLAAEHELLA